MLFTFEPSLQLKLRVLYQSIFRLSKVDPWSGIPPYCILTPCQFYASHLSSVQHNMTWLANFLWMVIEKNCMGWYDRYIHMARHVPREWSSGALGEQALHAAALLEVPGSPALQEMPAHLIFLYFSLFSPPLSMSYYWCKNRQKLKGKVSVSLKFSNNFSLIWLFNWAIIVPKIIIAPADALVSMQGRLAKLSWSLLGAMVFSVWTHVMCGFSGKSTVSETFVFCK